MKAVYKYPLTMVDKQEVSIPTGAKILSIQVQHNQICIWALVNTDNEFEKRTFILCGTGYSISTELQLNFIGTVLLYEGELVIHCFEETTDETTIL